MLAHRVPEGRVQEKVNFRFRGEKQDTPVVTAQTYTHLTLGMSMRINLESDLGASTIILKEESSVCLF
jgi:hypothetical protein